MRQFRVLVGTGEKYDASPPAFDEFCSKLRVSAVYLRPLSLSTQDPFDAGVLLNKALFDPRHSTNLKSVELTNVMRLSDS